MRISYSALYSPNLSAELSARHRMILGMFIMMANPETGRLSLRHNTSIFVELMDYKTFKKITKDLVMYNTLEDVSTPEDAKGYFTFRIKEPQFWCNVYIEEKANFNREDYAKKISLLHSTNPLHQSSDLQDLVKTNYEQIEQVEKEVMALFPNGIYGGDIEVFDLLMLRYLARRNLLRFCPPADEMLSAIIRGEYVNRDDLRKMVSYATRRNDVNATPEELDFLLENYLVNKTGLTRLEALKKIEENKNGYRNLILEAIQVPQYHTEIFGEAPKMNARKNARERERKKAKRSAWVKEKEARTLKQGSLFFTPPKKDE